MKLWLTRRHWEKFARTDPLWAVLSAPAKRGRRWTPEEFFATGRSEIDAAMAAVRARVPGLRRRHALDFGCGVGRLTQPLAAHFDRVTGVDLAEHMLAHARRHNAHVDRVAYVHNTRPDLACFADGTFDFVCSLITLQHIAPGYSARYIAEFLRVLAPDGVAWFQAPERSHEPVAGPTRFSLWPPTLSMRLKRRAWRLWNHFAAAQPLMEMHLLPRARVLEIVGAAGGEVLEVLPHDAGWEFDSFNYLVRKP